jgi:2-phosphoglycerate kinase
MNNEQMKQSLRHILWMGGSPCSGKSSVAEMLANQYGLAVYRCDDAFFEHAKRVDSGKHPTFHALTQMTWDEIWMRPMDVQVAEEIACYREEFEMIVADLLAYPKSQLVIAEGAALLPDCVSSLLLDRRRAVWIVPTEAFQRAHYTLEQRPWMRGILEQCEDPSQALENWMDRDVGFARQVAERAKELGLRLIEVDGGRTMAENTEIVAQYFKLMRE